MSAPRMTAREWGLLILLSFLWGGAFFASAVALKEVSHNALAFSRVAIAAVVLGGLGLAMRLPFPRTARMWGSYAVLALFSTALPFTLLYWAQTHIASGLAAILNAMTPIFTLLVAHVFTIDERLDARRLLGVVASVAGVGVIVGPSAIHFDGDVVAELAVLGAGCCYAVASVYSRRFRGEPPVVSCFAQMTFGSVFLLPVMVATGPALHVPALSIPVVGAILSLGVFSTAFAFVMFFYILRTAGATNAVLVTLLVPVSAILLGVVVLGETIAPRQFAGLSLIALGLLINDGRPVEAARARLARVWGHGDAPEAGR